MYAQKALSYTQKSYQYSVQAIKLMPVNDALVEDGDQGIKVITAEFSDELKKWQEMKGIPKSGELDYRTLSTLSEMQISEAITKRYEPQL